MLCKIRCIARRPRSSPRKAEAYGEVSITERVRRSRDSEHSIMMAAEQTSGWSSLMKDPSETQIRVPFFVAWYSQVPSPEYLSSCHQCVPDQLIRRSWKWVGIALGGGKGV